jgi:hypothetical protein
MERTTQASVLIADRITRFSGGSGLQMYRLMSEATVRWALSNANQHVICTERQLHTVIELRVTYGNLIIAARHCKNREEATRWSEQRRHAWEAYGWKR